MKRILSVLVMFAVLGGVSFALADTNDPIISYSYISNSYASSILTQGDSKISDSFESIDDVIENLEQRIAALSGGYVGYEFAKEYTELSLERGGIVTLAPGASVIPLQGTFLLYQLDGDCIDVSQGAEVGLNTTAQTNHRYFAAEETTVQFISYTNSAKVLVDGYYQYEISGDLPVQVQFIDINGHWAQEAIIYLAQNGIVNGMSELEFSPNIDMSREMFVTVLGRIYGVDTSRYTSSSFSDVDMDTWYGPYVAWASSVGVVEGYGDGVFGTGDVVTRQQMATLIKRYVDYAGLNIEIQNSNYEPFGDDAQLASWAVDSVRWAQQTGLLTGRPGNIFDPNGTATRAEVCTVLFRMLT